MLAHNYDFPQSLSQTEAAVSADSQPSVGNIRSTHISGMVSSIRFMVMVRVQACLRWFEDLCDEPAEETQSLDEVTLTESADDYLSHAAGVDQRIWYPGHSTEESLPAAVARPVVRIVQERKPDIARTFWPRSNFDWFILMTAVLAFTVVPLVWAIAALVF